MIASFSITGLLCIIIIMLLCILFQTPSDMEAYGSCSCNVKTKVSCNQCVQCQWDDRMKVCKSKCDGKRCENMNTTLCQACSSCGIDPVSKTCKTMKQINGLSKASKCNTCLSYGIDLCTSDPSCQLGVVKEQVGGTWKMDDKGKKTNEWIPVSTSTYQRCTAKLTPAEGRCSVNGVMINPIASNVK